MFLNKLRTSLRKLEFETVACFSVYIAYISYGLWRLYGVRDHVLIMAKHEFEPGWKFVGRLRDNTSDELTIFMLFLQKAWPCYVLHVIVSVLVRRFYPRRQSGAQALLCIVALMYLLHPLSMLLMAVMLLPYYAAAQFGSKTVTWLLLAFWMFLINYIRSVEIWYWYQTLGLSEYVYLMLTVSWSMLRCTSFALNRINDKKAGGADVRLAETYAFEHFLGYTLYLPCICYGPFLSYQRYTAHLKPEQQPPLAKLVLTLAWQLLRIAFWCFVLQLAMHFIYLHYMMYDYRAIELLDSTFTPYGVVYFMGMFFFVYYNVCYGVGIALAQFDGLNPPNRPRCVGRVHFFSDMWKYFDQGLYEFLFQHIYAELCGKHSPNAQKLFATVATFAFSVVWHGCYMPVFVWSALNMACVIVEKYFLAATKSRWYTECVTRRLGVRGAQRLRALFFSQLYIPAAFSNMYFFSGMEVGNHLMRGAYLCGLGNYVTLTMCCYCFFQCSEVILNLSKSKTDLSCRPKNVLNESNGSNKKDI